METMLAARYLGPNRIRAIPSPKPEIGPEEALIQVEACGFCGSDLGIVAGVHPRARPPLTIGHEFCGRVVEIRSSSPDISRGDRVTSYPLISCGRCYVCRHGQPHVCRQLRLYGFDVDGGMAEFVKLPVDSVIKVPETMPSRTGALIEPLAVAIHALARAPLLAEDTVVVLGAGPIGLLTALAVRHSGVKQLFITDILESRLGFARQMGLAALCAEGDTLLNTVRSVTDNEGADLIFECTGDPRAAVQVTALARCRGTIINVGVFKNPALFDLQAVNFKELTLIGSRVYSKEDFDHAVEIAPSLPLSELITHTLPLEHVHDAFQLFRAGHGVCKVLVEPVRRLS